MVKMAVIFLRGEMGNAGKINCEEDLCHRGNIFIIFFLDLQAGGGALWFFFWVGEGNVITQNMHVKHFESYNINSNTSIIAIGLIF